MTSSHPAPADAEVAYVRLLAGRGQLAAVARAASPAERRRLTAGAWAMAWPLVFARVTRPVEHRRGHFVCAASLPQLADECLHGFHDDVEAVVEDLLTHAVVPIRDVEAWMARRLTAVTVDAHRRRRGRRGALQRPRVPGWLADALSHDVWLMELAVEILNWVGVTASAGADVWPLQSWAARRVAVTGDWVGSDAAAVVREVEEVLAAMRRRPAWFARYVERPMGAKPAPVAATPVDETADQGSPATGGEIDEARLRALAAAVIDALDEALGRGADPHEAVVRIVTAVFGEGTGGDELDRVPGSAPAFDERISARLADPAVVARVVAAVQQIVCDPER